MTSLLSAKNVHGAYNSKQVLHDVSLDLNAGEIVALLGPNGSGKSTLLRALLGQLPGFSGQITWSNRPLHDWSLRDLAKTVAYLPQVPTWEPSQRIHEVLRLGRAPYWGPFGLESTEDQRIVEQIAQRLDLADLLHRRMDQLSGGQRQRVFLARCLAQQPKALLLDEPNTFLDLKHQLELAQLLRSLARDQNLAILLASHDLNLAGSFADRLILLHDGAVAATGIPGEILRPELLERVYQVSMHSITAPDGRPVVFPRT